MEKNIKFESALEELEKITEKLESGDATLAESLKLYEKGIGLVRVCAEQLDAAEQKVILLQTENDTVKEKDFLKNED